MDYMLRSALERHHASVKTYAKCKYLNKDLADKNPYIKVYTESNARHLLVRLQRGHSGIFRTSTLLAETTGERGAHVVINMLAVSGATMASS
ncbi:hypothetical protein [Escherichia coli]|uniref:hypothetical protein n=1 Tax=Escherichia coli TaxID=562 RepID=UPI00397643EE